MAKVQDLMKGELDWHEKINANFHAVEDAAEAAQGGADDAASAAAAAQQTADTAVTNAAAAQSAANTAQSTADGAQSAAEAAQSAADDAQSTADAAQSAASTAQSTADGAVSSAAAASQAAATAQTTADNAQSSANQKLPKPVNSPFTEGLVYQNSDGTTAIRPGGGFKYTIEVDNGTDGSPAAVTYYDDCSGFNPGKGSDMGDWGVTDLVKNYFRPCVIQPGATEPAYFLMQNNMTKKEDGSAANLTGTDGDVMIQVRKLYGKFTKSGKTLRVSISNVKEDATWFCFNDIAGVEKDFLYVGAFEAGVASGAATVMRSISGVAPLVNITRDTARTYATNRGDGYHQNNPFMVFLWEVMFLMVYKTRASQEVLGKGRTGTSSAALTGLLADKPFCYGNQDGVTGVKFLGRENFYGNVWEFVDGIVLTSGTYKLTRDPSKYNDTGEGYEISQAAGFSGSSGQYVKEVQGTNDLGFLPKVTGGSEITFWCDCAWWAMAVQIALFGGGWDSAARAGAFCWVLTYAPSYSYSGIGSRLCRE